MPVGTCVCGFLYCPRCGDRLIHEGRRRPTPPPPAGALDAAELAAKLKVTEGGLDKMHREGRLPKAVRVGQKYFWLEDDLRAWGLL